MVSSAGKDTTVDVTGQYREIHDQEWILPGMDITEKGQHRNGKGKVRLFCRDWIPKLENDNTKKMEEIISDVKALSKLNDTLQRQ